jgi:hypothetical protein
LDYPDLARSVNGHLYEEPTLQSLFAGAGWRIIEQLGAMAIMREAGRQLEPVRVGWPELPPMRRARAAPSP